MDLRLPKAHSRHPPTNRKREPPKKIRRYLRRKPKGLQEKLTMVRAI
jgi:hypothetical protein